MIGRNGLIQDFNKKRREFLKDPEEDTDIEANYTPPPSRVTRADSDQNSKKISSYAAQLDKYNISAGAALATALLEDLCMVAEKNKSTYFSFQLEVVMLKFPLENNNLSPTI